MKNNCKNFYERKILKFQWMKHISNLNEWKFVHVWMNEKLYKFAWMKNCTNLNQCKILKQFKCQKKHWKLFECMQNYPRITRTKYFSNEINQKIYNSKSDMNEKF